MADTQGGGGSIAAYSAITDLLKPYHYAKLLRKYGNNFGANDGMGSLFLMAEASGSTENLSNQDLHWWEEGWIINNGTVQSVAGAGGPGTAITITLTAASHGPNGQSNFRVNDWIYLSSIGATTAYPYAFITAITPTANANVLTVAPFDAATDISAGGPNQVQAGDTLFIAGNSYAEGTGGRTSLTTPPTKLTHYYQIIKETYSVTGSAMGAENWIDMGEGAGNFQYRYDQINAFKRHTMDIDLALLLGRRATNPLITATSGSTMDGLIPRIRYQGGQNPAYGGVITTTFFDSLNNTLDRQGSPDLYHLWAGNLFEQRLENWLPVQFKNGDIRYYTYSGAKDGGAEINMGFKSFTKSGRTFTYKKYGMFQHPQLAGTANFKFNESAIAMPQADVRLPGTSELKPAWTIIYRKQGNGVVRKAIMAQTGMLAPTPTNDIDSLTWNATTELSARFPIINQYALIAPW